MTVIEREPGQAVQVGAYTLRVVAIRGGEVEVALFGPGEDVPEETISPGAFSPRRVNRPSRARPALKLVY
jgi:hypothetical protein